MIIISGTAGSGKTTQGKLLAAQLGCPFFSMGELLRKYGSPEIQAKMKAGLLLSNEETLPVFETFFEGFHGSQAELVTDGFPRSLDQAEWILGKISDGKLKFTAMVHLFLSEEQALQRLLARARSDDSMAAIKERFKEQDGALVDILNLFRSHGLKVYEIEGAGTVEEVASRVNKALNL